MNTLSDEFYTIFDRDLHRLIKNLEAIPEALLWTAPDGVTNSAGVLAQHVTGNLNHYIGTAIGETGYERRREQEFTGSGRSKKALIDDIKELQQVLEDTFRDLNEKRLNEDYPVDFPFDTTVRGALIHLYGNLNYHLGQFNYLRRMLSAGDFG